MPHHSQEHQHFLSHESGKNIRIAFFANLTFTAIEFVGGWLTNSVAVISDSIHDLGCSLSLGLAWVFDKIAKRPASKRFTLGYGRFTLLGAFINAFILLAGSSIVIYESIQRLISPEEVGVQGVFWIAILAIAFKGFAVLRTWKGKNVNEHMVSLHLLGDCLGWVVILLASILMMFVKIPLLDPILSVLISLYILFNVIYNLVIAFNVVLEGMPTGIRYDEIFNEIQQVVGVKEIKSLHVWSMDNQEHIAEVVVASNTADCKELEQVKQQVKLALMQHQITRTTVEFEF